MVLAAETKTISLIIGTQRQWMYSTFVTGS